MVYMAIAGCVTPLFMVLEEVAEKMEIPYYASMGAAEVLLGLLIAFAILCRRESVQRSELKWVLLRGFFGTTSFLMSLLAVSAGAPLGDVNALGSINVVVAALLGRLFLGEDLRVLHILALCCSVIGAFMVSKPEELLGLKPTDGMPWLGYGFALLSGFCYGGIFIASRKSQDVSVYVMTFSVIVQEATAFWILSLTGLVKDAPLQLIFEAPLRTLALTAGLFVMIVVLVLSLTLGSQKCPAAVSSTIMTSVQMSLGYALQTLTHHEPPQLLTLLGAGLMLLAVSLMAFARWTAKSPASPEEVQSPASTSSMKSDVSLASFIASEFSGLSQELRQRPAAVVVGRAMA
eukprot:TRINITY_DN94894_c0_g1_i1.p1 TRINITY_DN94894_c0_g1~~TRINITY_DN94894_c0_g1_i1.p1  ORF type:complete len:375 (+),score=80.47 TRINITY_DN94894_c0_g1_i1:86-1126(+)